MIEHLIPILAGTLGAAVPLIFAGLGELVAERTGVINLGVEGMMLVGAIAGFLMALIYLGGEAAQVGLQMPFAITGIFQGMLLFFLLGSDVFIDNRLRRSA